MSQIFKIDDKEVTDNLIAVLATLEELWPEEVRVIDYVEITCNSPRARQVVAALAGAWYGSDDSDETHTILSTESAIKIGLGGNS
jgi:hypothetical protein